MWNARNKFDLIVEVWEKLDCESVGAVEIEAISEAVRGVYGDAAVDSPMKIARLLADEGAELRHSEIMALFVQHCESTPYTAEFRNILRLDSFPKALASIRNLENLRKKFASAGDREGLRLIRERSIAAKSDLTDSPADREIAQWLTVWLQTPDAFETWITLRKRSPEFLAKFPDVK